MNHNACDHWETCLELGRRARHRWAFAVDEVGGVIRGSLEAVGICGAVGGLSPEVLTPLPIVFLRSKHTHNILQNLGMVPNCLSHMNHNARIHRETCLFVRGVRAVHVAVAAPPLGHAVPVAAGELVLAVAVAARTFDVSKIFRISRNLSVQLVRQIELSLNPPPPRSRRHMHMLPWRGSRPRRCRRRSRPPGRTATASGCTCCWRR